MLLAAYKALQISLRAAPKRLQRIIHFDCSLPCFSDQWNHNYINTVFSGWRFYQIHTVCKLVDKLHSCGVYASERNQKRRFEMALQESCEEIE